MSFHALTSCSHKLMNLRGQDADPGRVNLTPCNPSKTQSSKALPAPASQSRKPPTLRNHDKLQKTTIQ